MISSSVRGGRGRRVDPGRQAANTRALFVSVLALLLATGWVANHFVALMPVISDREHLSTATLDGIFGIYALGLLPGLLIGGRTSDALGRRPVALAGAAADVAGTVVMLLSQHTDALLVGRLVVGLGVGLAVSSGTAWASDLRGPAGAATAGAVLTAGFAIGPFAGGGFAWAGQSGVRVSFAVAVAIVVLASVAVTVAAGPGTDVAGPAPAPDTGPAVPAAQGVSRALSWAIPLAPWVYASATLGFVTIPTRIHTALAAPIAAGTATLIVNGVSGVVQVLARTRRWGPQTGTAGAALAAVGYAVAAIAPPTLTPVVGLPLLLILGCASGLCLREGLIDLEAAAPQHLRGALTGVFYVVTYIGFALPLLLATLESAVSVAILSAMAALALATAVGRAVRLRRDCHRQN
ncbi:MFS transporter [Mycobacterium marseillense]|uniref:MFS transporter n=1 Tax=Mycobacterium marseillense TaxID=701042 RepID=A0AAC9VQG6_9MYCO|nr:MFS transporter [Mycobacterium marseillense]ASW88562.1 MFS transporter [Mycobacterium marseillense]MCA2264662.1 MFS transporter [Mycobacterium marseillense]OBJ71819.1 MFS transporter [Mycobacterium marseillense]